MRNVRRKPLSEALHLEWKLRVLLCVKTADPPVKSGLLHPCWCGFTQHYVLRGQGFSEESRSHSRQEVVTTLCALWTLGEILTPVNYAVVFICVCYPIWWMAGQFFTFFSARQYFLPWFFYCAYKQTLTKRVHLMAQFYLHYWIFWRWVFLVSC